MENIQINGQKIWGPPRDWTGPPPPHGTEIYIKNLPDDVYEIELFQIFSVMGRVYEVRLPVHWSGVNRGYAFVRYTKISEADAAIKAFDAFEIRSGRPIKIERSVDNTRLFLSCVPTYKTSQDIQRDLQTVVDNVEKVYVYPTLENPTVFRGYAFVEFKSHRDAAIAKRILTPDVCFNLFEKKCVAAWANPLPFLNEKILKTINILFMRNVPKEVKSSAVKRAIENILQDNSIQKVKRLNDFAFLTFKNHDSAKAALNIIKNHPGLLGSTQIQVEWAVPKEINNINLKESSKILNISLPKESKYFIKDSKAKLGNNNNFNNLNLTDSQNRTEIVEQVFSRSQTKFRKILNDSREKLKGVRTGYVEPSLSTTKNDSYESISESVELLTPTILSNCFENIPDLRSTEADWMLSPGTDLESEKSLRSPQMKRWLGNFAYSSCSSSPALTASSAESPVYWSNEEVSSPKMCSTSDYSSISFSK